MTLIFFLVLSLWAAEGLTNISDQIIESTVPVDFDFPEDTSSGLGKFKPRSLMGSPVSRSKKSFHGLKCRGNFHKKAFTALNRVCEDCYSLFKIPELYSMCRFDCFKSEYFVGCLEDLQLRDKGKYFEEMISIIG